MFLSYLKASLSTKLMDGCNKIQEYEWSVAKASNRKQRWTQLWPIHRSQPSTNMENVQTGFTELWGLVPHLIKFMLQQIVKFQIWFLKFCLKDKSLSESDLQQLKLKDEILTPLFRLFIRSSGPGDPPTPHQIGYLNVVPACTDPGGVFSMPKFADFGTTIANINAMFRQNPIQGNTILQHREKSSRKLVIH